MIEKELLALRSKDKDLVLKDREEELLEIKGPCSDPECSLHYAHRGPHDIKGV